METGPSEAMSATIALPSPEATGALAGHLATMLLPGDCILLHGPVGAGKSHFCRSLIQARLRDEDRHEDVPSPTFTLIQTYTLRDVDIWHADLYRLTLPEEIAELGLEEAFETAITLVEWPDRLGDGMPENALTLALSEGDTEEARVAAICASAPRWRPVIASMLHAFGTDDG